MGDIIPEISLGAAVAIVKYHLNDNEPPITTTAKAIGRVANMETHNSITKYELIQALRWLYEHYDFDTEPIVHGQWNLNYAADYECSECGYENTWETAFCPNCGAKMDGGVEEADKTRKDEPKPMTNADRIRGMTDEELEEIIQRVSTHWEPWCDRNCEAGADCNDCLRKWLQQPVEEDVE